MRTKINDNISVEIDDNLITIGDIHDHDRYIKFNNNEFSELIEIYDYMEGNVDVIPETLIKQAINETIDGIHARIRDEIKYILETKFYKNASEHEISIAKNWFDKK